jgi:hypothetical protein
MADPSARRRLSFGLCGDGFGPLYNAAKPSKQATDPHKDPGDLDIFPGWFPRGFASAGRRAYLGVVKRLVEIS